MGNFTEKFGGVEQKADVINHATPGAEVKCPNCKSTDLFRAMGTTTVVCTKCRKEISL